MGVSPALAPASTSSQNAKQSNVGRGSNPSFFERVFGSRSDVKTGNKEKSDDGNRSMSPLQTSEKQPSDETPEHVLELRLELPPGESEPGSSGTSSRNSSTSSNVSFGHPSSIPISLDDLVMPSDFVVNNSQFGGFIRIIQRNHMSHKEVTNFLYKHQISNVARCFSNEAYLRIREKFKQIGEVQDSKYVVFELMQRYSDNYDPLSTLVGDLEEGFASRAKKKEDVDKRGSRESRASVIREMDRMGLEDRDNTSTTPPQALSSSSSKSSSVSTTPQPQLQAGRRSSVSITPPPSPVSETLKVESGVRGRIVGVLVSGISSARDDSEKAVIKRFEEEIKTGEFTIDSFRGNTHHVVLDREGAKPELKAHLESIFDVLYIKLYTDPENGGGTKQRALYEVVDSTKDKAIKVLKFYKVGNGH